MRISILAIASVLALILAGCKPADDTPPADPRAGVESAARSPEPAPRAAAITELNTPDAPGAGHRAQYKFSPKKNPPPPPHKKN